MLWKVPVSFIYVQYTMAINYFLIFKSSSMFSWKCWRKIVIKYVATTTTPGETVRVKNTTSFVGLQRFLYIKLGRLNLPTLPWVFSTSRYITKMKCSDVEKICRQKYPNYLLSCKFVLFCWKLKSRFLDFGCNMGFSCRFFFIKPKNYCDKNCTIKKPLVSGGCKLNVYSVHRQGPKKMIIFLLLKVKLKSLSGIVRYFNCFIFRFFLIFYTLLIYKFLTLHSHLSGDIYVVFIHVFNFGGFACVCVCVCVLAK